MTGISTIPVTNTEPFTVNGVVLIGDFGKADAEIFTVIKIDAVSDILTLGDINANAATTAFPHTESTKVTTMPFNQVRFYHTVAQGGIADDTPVFDSNTPLTGWLPLDPSSYYTIYEDFSFSTGFGWFIYKNSISFQTSSNSNALPYAGFGLNTAQQVFGEFDSMMNTKELQLVTMADKFSWLNEALSIFKNKLNLSDVEYTTSTPQTITTVSGTAEYLLPDDFSDVVEIINPAPTIPLGDATMDFIPVSQVLNYNQTNPTVTRYYLRGRYIGFAPTPTSAVSYNYTYRAKASRVTSVSTIINLPDNGFYVLKDWLLFRALSKFQNPNAALSYKRFDDAVNLAIQASVKRSANLDTWDLGSGTNT